MGFNSGFKGLTNNNSDTFRWISLRNSIWTCSPFSFLWTGVALPEDMSWPARRALLCLTYFTPRRRPSSTTGFAYKIASSIVKVSRLCVQLNYVRRGWLLQIIVKKMSLPYKHWQRMSVVTYPIYQNSCKKNLWVKKLWMHQQNNGLHTFYVCACKQTSTPVGLHYP